MHSKHDLKPHHTMATTYTPYYSPYAHIHLSTHRPSWPESQAAMILSFRDVSNPQSKVPDQDVRAFDKEKQIHARWTDPDLMSALLGLQASVSPNVKLSLKYGGRDVTAATWIIVHQTLPSGAPEIIYVLWFHEYDDLDVEVGELAGVKWTVKTEDMKVELDEVQAIKMETDELEGIKKENTNMDGHVKMEDVDIDG